MDQYNEKLVNGKASGGQYAIVCGLMVVSLLLVYTSVFLAPAAFPLFLLSVWGVIHFLQNLKVEFEYTLTNGDIDVAKIVAKRSRKTIKNIKAEEIQAVYKADDPHVVNDLDIKKDLTVVNFTDNAATENLVAVYAEQKTKKYVYILELDDECVAHLRQTLKSKVMIKK